MLNKVDQQYDTLCRDVLNNGLMIHNQRTGKGCLTSYGHMMKFDMNDGFPLLTTKKVLFKPLAAELIGFLRAYDNARDFRNLGCNIWDANANETIGWLENPNRRGHDDLGRIYGVQARKWRDSFGEIDQLKRSINKIKNRSDDRGLIVTHWNPAELDEMALRPCHLLYQFGIVNDRLDLCMYQRSADIPLGVPFNIASYALMLHIVAKYTGLKAGIFTHFIANAHVYEDQIDILNNIQLQRQSAGSPPNINISDEICILDDISKVEMNMFEVTGYVHHPFIKYPFTA